MVETLYSLTAVSSQPADGARTGKCLFWLGAFFLALASALSLTGCGGSQAQEAPPATPEVTVAAVVEREINRWDDFTGRLEAVQSVAVRPRVSGYVEAIQFREGATVQRGDLLFRIDARPYAAAVRSARANLDRGRAELALAEANRSRAQQLSSSQGISRQEIDRRVADAEAARANVASLEAALAAAELDLGFTSVRAPITGRISRAAVTAGNLVSSNDVLTLIASIDPIHVRFDVDEHAFLRYVGETGKATAHGNRVLVGLADEDGFPRVGRLDFLDIGVDPATGTIRARAVLPNLDGRLVPGLYARVRLLSAEAMPTVLVDDRAIGTELGKRYVLVVDDENTVAYRPVTLGARVEGLRIISSGLAPGERIVVNGLQRARPGTVVKPVPGRMAAPEVASAQAKGG